MKELEDFTLKQVTDYLIDKIAEERGIKHWQGNYLSMLLLTMWL